MASKLMSASLIGGEFERAFDEVFEDILIRRWRGPARTRNFGDAVVIEDEELYRVRIALPGADPQQLEVEVSEWRLVVRIRAMHGLQERSFDFSHRVEIDRVTARFDDAILEVMVPKAARRKIEVR